MLTAQWGSKVWLQLAGRKVGEDSPTDSSLDSLTVCPFVCQPG